MNKVGAVLLDTRGIQKYVFASNKMKTNIGASYLVDTIYEMPVTKVLSAMGFVMPVKAWRDTSELQMLKDGNGNITAEIAYVGGGNMLLLLRPKIFDGNQFDEVYKECKNFVYRWSKELLLYTPGLQTGAAIGVFNLDEIKEDPKKFQGAINILYKQLKENQSNIMPQVDLPYTGLSLECDYSGKTANVNSKLADNRMVSAEVEAKMRAASYADIRLKEQYGNKLQYEKDGKTKTLKFAETFEQLGYKDGESYITVIHIDGNNMGVKFSHCETMQDRKQLSAKVAAAVKTAFEELLEQIKAEYLKENLYDKYLDLQKLNKEKETIYLPIRPIIIGGDDITFVTPGRLGLHYAEYFMRCANKQELITEEQQKHFEVSVNQGIKDENKKIKLQRTLSCCAGVAIVPAKYPFFRAYALAEELCSSAKKRSRQDDSSWLDFAILHGETYPSVKQLWNAQYRGIADDKGKARWMHYGPYRVNEWQKAEKNQPKKRHELLQSLFDLRKDLQASHKGSANKVKLLREILFKDMHSQEIFLENDSAMKELLKQEQNRKGQNAEVTAVDFWEKKEIDGKEITATRYIDAIEIEDFIIPGKEDSGK